MRGRVQGVAILALAMVAGGCLLTTELDGLSDGPGPSAEGGSLEAAALDAPADTRSPVDAGTDGDAADGAPPPFRCPVVAPIPAFCTDFDQGTLGSIIGSPNTALGGAVSIDGALSLSPDRSLEVTMPKLVTGTGRASVGRNFGFMPQSSMTIQFDLHLDNADPSSTNMVSMNMGGYNFTLFIGATAKVREGIPGDGGLVYTSTDRNAPNQHKWVRVLIAFAIVDGASSVTLSYDGVAQSAVPLVIDQYRATNWRVDVGLNYVGSPDDGRNLHIDNLVIDAK